MLVKGIADGLDAGENINVGVEIKRFLIAHREEVIKAERLDSCTEFCKVVFERHIYPLARGYTFQHVFRHDNLLWEYIWLLLKLIRNEYEEIRFGVMPTQGFAQNLSQTYIVFCNYGKRTLFHGSNVFL